MNRIFTLIISIFLCVGLNAQTVNKPLIFKKTATWCPSCGTWGWSFMKDLMTEFEDNNAVVVGLHYSGDLQNSVALAINNNFPTGGQPIFMFNGRDQFVNGSIATAKLEDLKTMTSEFNGFTPEFEIEINASKASDVAEIIFGNVTITPNITDADMDYYLGLYLLENDVIAAQSGTTENNHPRVLQGSFTDSPFGDLAFSSGSTLDPSNQFNLNGQFDMSTLQNTNGLDGKLDAMAVIWSYDGSKYEVVQAEIFPELDFEVATEEIAWASEISLFVDGNKTLNFNASSVETIDNVQVSIYDLTGKLIVSENINVNGTTINYTINMSTYNSGNYMLHIQKDSEIWSSQFSRF